MKKFLLLSLVFALPLSGLFAYCYIFFQFNYMTGDLGRMGEIPFGREYGRTLVNNYLSDNYTVNYTNDKNERNYTIFSFGDSFSGAEIAGYQNYIGHILGDSVLNVRNNPKMSIMI